MVNAGTVPSRSCGTSTAAICISIQRRPFRDPGLLAGEDLVIGSSGNKVRQIQEQLDAVATVYSAVPRIAADGIYGPATARAVEAFQSVFGLPVTGTVDFSTWYKISHIYVGVTRIAELK